MAQLSKKETSSDPHRGGTPAAAYLRMSKDLQKHSIENQRLVIEKYADERGFEIVRFYEDSVAVVCE